MKDLVVNYDKSVSESRNFGRTEADLIAQLINDRDDLQQALREKDKRILDITKDYDFMHSRVAERTTQLKMIWESLDYIIDELPYQNRTKKETQKMISEVMNQIKNYLRE